MNNFEKRALAKRVIYALRKVAAASTTASDSDKGIANPPIEKPKEGARALRRSHSITIPRGVSRNSKSSKRGCC